jgi:SAM-dependent methyltransferase
VSLYQEDLAYIHDAGFGGLASRFAPGVLRLLRTRDPGAARRRTVVDIGCGSGILASRLAAAHYDVVGIDASPAMIRLARSRVPRARFRVASLVDARLPPAIAVVAIGEVVSYVPGGIRALRRFFGRVRKSLSPGGVFIFDFIESARRRTFRGHSFAGADWALVASAAADRSGRRITRTITTFRKIGSDYRQTQETHRVRIYSRRDIGRALSTAGFEFTMRRSMGAYRLIAGDVVVIAMRPKAGAGRASHARQGPSR